MSKDFEKIGIGLAKKNAAKNLGFKLPVFPPTSYEPVASAVWEGDGGVGFRLSITNKDDKGKPKTEMVRVMVPFSNIKTAEEKAGFEVVEVLSDNKITVRHEGLLISSDGISVIFTKAA